MALNIIWVGFFILAFVVALVKLVFFNDTEVFPLLVSNAFDSAKTAFEISIWLTGLLALWMGMMNIADKSGLVRVLARLVGPFFRRLFPSIPKGHPAMGPIIMNISANFLGLDNASTPLGLKAMEEMQKLNPFKEEASDPQIMFLVLNTSGLTVIPITVMAYRSQMGALNPSDVFIPILLATICSTIAGLIMVAAYQKINLLDKVLLAYLGGILLFMVFTLYIFSGMSPEDISKYSSVMSNVIIFSVLVCIISYGSLKRMNVYELFVEGAKGGFDIAIRLIPFLVAILVAIGVFRASGCLQLIMDGLLYLVDIFEIDGSFVHVLPTALMKPLSGSGARGLMIDTMRLHGADSLIGRMACTLQGATDTTLYIIAVYFGSVGIQKPRYAIKCGLVADTVGIVAAILISYLFFT